MFLAILISVILLDQISKYIAYLYLQPQNTIPVINRFFYLTYMENSRDAFVVLGDKVWLLIILACAVVIGASICIYRDPRMKTVKKIGISLLAAGLVGNLIDRMRLGFVIDFFDFQVCPIFNIADISLVLGSLILMLAAIFRSRKKVY